MTDCLGDIGPEDTRRLLAYRWYNPDSALTDAPAIELRVRYDPATEDPHRLLHQLRQALVKLTISLSEEERAWRTSQPRD